MYFYENKKNELMIRRETRLAFPPHVHDHIELVYVIDGKSTASVNFRDYPLQRGDSMIVFPNQIHSYSKDEDLDCFLLIFPARYCEEFSSTFQQKEPIYPSIPKSKSEMDEFTLLHAMWSAHENKDAFYQEKAKGYLLIFLAQLLAQTHLRDKRSLDSFSVLQVLDYCQYHFQEDITLEEMADKLSLSATYLSHLMNDRLGMGFRDYINRLRIAEAERLLQNRAGSITEIAMQVGFNSTRSFNRVFKARLGMTPRQYMQENLS